MKGTGSVIGLNVYELFNVYVSLGRPGMISAIIPIKISEYKDSFCRLPYLSVMVLHLSYLPIK